LTFKRRLEQATLSVPWPDLMRDLSQLHAVRVELDGRNYLCELIFKEQLIRPLLQQGCDLLPR